MDDLDKKARSILIQRGYDPDDPVPYDEQGQRIIPTKLLEALSNTRIVNEESFNRYKVFLHSVELSSKQLQYLKLLSTGATNKEIAQQMGVSLETVKTTLVVIYGKLDIRLGPGANVAAVSKAFCLGILRPEWFIDS